MNSVFIGQLWRKNRKERLVLKNKNAALPKGKSGVLFDRDT
jgi:hypothetical protein